MMVNKMLNLEDRTWKSFEIGLLFETVYNSKAYHKTDLIESEKGIAYISRTNENNGFESVVQNNNYMVNNKNTIVFGAENAKFFFQPFEYITGNKMYVIKSELLKNRYIALFLQQMLNNSIKECGFGYGKGLIGSRILKRFFLLPVTDLGTPDWQFMEDYIQEREQLLIRKYVCSKINLGPVSKVCSFEEKEWSIFRITDIFPEIQRGKRLKRADHISGSTPYVSSSAVNNGIDNFISNKREVRKFEDCLTLANSGSVGKTFYHNYVFVGSDHITTLKNESFSPYVYLFLAPIISRLKEKYNFNHEINDNRINKEVLLLPVSDAGEPDWNYMEEYVKFSIYQKICIYFEFLKEKKLDGININF